jgi:hypothetical protein
MTQSQKENSVFGAKNEIIKYVVGSLMGGGQIKRKLPTNLTNNYINFFFRVVQPGASRLAST